MMGIAILCIADSTSHGRRPKSRSFKESGGVHEERSGSASIPEVCSRGKIRSMTISLRRRLAPLSSP